MKTSFVEYIERRDQLQNLFDSIVFEAKNNEDLNEILQEAGFFGNLWNAGKQFVQGVKQGGQAAYSQMTGPNVQVNTAMTALKKALAQIQQDPNWNQSKTTGSSTLPSMPLVNWLTETIKELESQAQQFQNKQMPGNIPTTAAQNAPGTAYDASGTKFPATPPTPWLVDWLIDIF